MLRISAVRYSNSYPLIYGLREKGIDQRTVLEIDHPADCAMKLSTGKVDIGLVPVAVIPDIKGARIISDYCIGSTRSVRTVLLLSNTPFDKIKTIFLDYRSRSSVALTRVLARLYWRRDVIWKHTNPEFDFRSIDKQEAVMLIGDQCFEMEKQFKYKTDLAEEWNKFTGLPFVFACWVSNKIIDPSFIIEFNAALEFGINNIEPAIEKYGKMSSMPVNILRSYLFKNIDFRLTDEKKMAMNIFFKYLKEIK